MFPPPPDPWAPPGGRLPGTPVALKLVIAAAAGLFLLVAALVVAGLIDRLDAPVVPRAAPEPTPYASEPPLAPSGPCAEAYFDVADPYDDGTLPGMPPQAGIRTSGVVRATIVLTHGPVEVELYPDRAPCTVHSFLFLAGVGFFDGTQCHRLTTRDVYLFQCGDPSGVGGGGPGYRIKDENGGQTDYPRGTLAMARRVNPNTAGSQFFFVYRDSDLKPGYTIFGRVVRGMEVLDRIAAAGVGKPVSGPYDGRPAEHVQIHAVETKR